MVTTYELMLLVKTLATELDEKKIKALVEETITGKVKEISLFAKKALAYPIKKEKEACFWLLNIETAPKDISGMKHKLKSNEQILRFLLLAKE